MLKRPTHTGIVEAVGRDFLKIKIADPRNGSCGGCGIAGLCGSLPEHHEIVVTRPGVGVGYDVGDKVVVEAVGGVEWLALGVAILVPLIVFVGTLLGLLSWGLTALASALLSLCALGSYFLLLKGIDRRIRSRIMWHVEPYSIGNH